MNNNRYIPQKHGLAWRILDQKTGQPVTTRYFRQGRETERLQTFSSENGAKAQAEKLNGREG